MVTLRPRWPVHQFTAAIGAAIIQCFGTGRAKSAFERTDESAGSLGGKISAAAFAIRAHFQHQPAASFTVAQIASTSL